MKAKWVLFLYFLFILMYENIYHRNLIHRKRLSILNSEENMKWFYNVNLHVIHKLNYVQNITKVSVQNDTLAKVK